jgi:hypothetical protein
MPSTIGSILFYFLVPNRVLLSIKEYLVNLSKKKKKKLVIYFSNFGSIFFFGVLNFLAFCVASGIIFYGILCAVSCSKAFKGHSVEPQVLT